MKNQIILKTIALLMVSTLFLTSTACNSLSDSIISADKATTIASSYISPNLLVHAEISNTTFPLNAKKPDAWVILFEFNSVLVTSEELVKFGWAPGECQPPDDSYRQILISVDARTGIINYKVATDAPYLGGHPAVSYFHLHRIVKSRRHLLR